MAKRFFASEIWEEDWFLDMPNEYKQYWFYMLAKCDHAGIFRVNLRTFRGLIEVNLSSNRALELINTGKQRIRVIKEDVWLIEDFFVYQYGPKFSIKNRVHLSVAAIYEKHGIDLTSIRGLIVPKHGVKDKDKDNEEVESREEKGGMGEKEGNWPKMPGAESVELAIPEIKAGSAMQLMHLNGNKATMEQVYQLWGVFKVQHFTGKKFYDSPDEAFSHFINWAKTQKINGTHQQQPSKSNPKTAGLNKLLGQVKDDIRTRRSADNQG